jgi:hypothetical protein
MTIPLNGGDLFATTRASTLADTVTLSAMHTAQLAATVGTAAYADGVMVSTVHLTPTGTTVVTATLAQVIFTTITAMRTMAYLPTANVTDSDPSTYYLTRNFVTICDAVEAAVIATGAGVSTSNNFYTSPVVIFVAAYAALCVLGCVVVFILSKRALDFRLVPLERMSKLPNSVLQRLESAAASSVAAAERAIEYSENAAGGDDESQEEDEAIHWRSANLTQTSKDMQKGTSERPRERLIFSCVLMAPLLASSVIFILLVDAIWGGTQAAGANSNALTAVVLTQVAVRQTVYYGVQGATLSDAEGRSSLAASVLANAEAAARVDAMFFGAAGDAAADAALETVHFGDLCAPGVLPLSALEKSRCSTLGGGVCHSGLHASFGLIIRRVAALVDARKQFVYPEAPSASQVLRLRALLDQQWISHMRIISINEAAMAMAIDVTVRAARVQAAVTGAINTGNVLVSVIVVGVVAYQVRCAAGLRESCDGGRAAAPHPVPCIITLAWSDAFYSI